MYTLKLICPVLLLLGVRAHCFLFEDYQRETAAILELLGKTNANKPLINTVVDCMGSTFDSKGKSEDFLRCVNDMIHTDDLTNTDSIKYIIGNYAARVSRLLFKCYYEKGDLIYCLRSFADCLPLLLRNLYGYSEHNRTCKRLIDLPGYDGISDYDPNTSDEEYFDNMDDLYSDTDENFYDDYDDYDYDYDTDGDFDGMSAERRASPGTSSQSPSSGDRVEDIQDPDNTSGHDSSNTPENHRDTL